MSNNTWPLMDGALIPDGLTAMQPWYLNPFENVLTVQFDHRMMAYLVAALAVAQGWLAWRSGDLLNLLLCDAAPLSGAVPDRARHLYAP